MEDPDEAEWNWIKPHLARDAVILVSSRLGLPEVGKRIATDDTETVKTWLDQGLIAKPTKEQIEHWERDSKARFLVLVIQPYVLVQEVNYN